jgi:hypothetical protein
MSPEPAVPRPAQSSERQRRPGGPNAPQDPRDVSVCIICGGAAVARKCKIVCQNCGYTRDCSDP